MGPPSCCLPPVLSIAVSQEPPTQLFLHIHPAAACHLCFPLLSVRIHLHSCSSHPPSCCLPPVLAIAVSQDPVLHIHPAAACHLCSPLFPERILDRFMSEAACHPSVLTPVLAIQVA